MRHRSALVLLVLTVACGGDGAKKPPAKPPDPSPEGCAPGELTQDDGTCLAAGIPSDACGAGFETDGALGCNAILPADACPPGQMALPGETACHALAACGRAPFGDIPVDAQTEYVDGAFSGTSDGSAAKPWTTLGDAVAAAAPGAVVAVAAGSYAEDVVLSKPVRLWGRCPEMVEIAGLGNIAAVRVNADGAEVRGLAVRGLGGGVVVAGAADVMVENVWAHDTVWHGMHVEAYGAPASATIRGSLIEHGGAFGLYVYGAVATVEDVVVRDTEPDAKKDFGYGMHVEDKDGLGGKLTVTHAVVERSTTVGIGDVGSDLAIASTIVRDTRPTALSQLAGRGVNAENDPFTQAPATLAIDTSVVERAHDHGIYLAGVTASVTHTVVRDTQPDAASGHFGRALNVIADDDAGVPSKVTVKQSLFERSYDAGVAVFGSTLDAELIVVRQTRLEQATQSYGNGVFAQFQPPMRAALSLRSSVVEDSQLFGVVVGGSDAQVLASRVSGTAARPDGVFGDGISAFTITMATGPATLRVESSLVASNARGGVSAFGSTMTLSSTTLECNLIDLLTETSAGAAPVLEDQGSNVCGCQQAKRECAAATAGVAPPEALPSN